MRLSEAISIKTKLFNLVEEVRMMGILKRKDERTETVTVRADDLHINTTDATVSTVVDRQFACTDLDFADCC